MPLTTKLVLSLLKFTNSRLYVSVVKIEKGGASEVYSLALVAPSPKAERLFFILCPVHTKQQELLNYFHFDLLLFSLVCIYIK